MEYNFGLNAMSPTPPFHNFLNPTLKALKALGGSGTIREINDKVVEGSNLDKQTIGRLHNPETSNETEIDYRLAWCRTYLKNYGLIENSSRGIWALTDKAEKIQEVDPKEILRFVRLQQNGQGRNQPRPDAIQQLDPDSTSDDVASWKAQLHRLLTKDLGPSAFERLVQRLLRESGFVQVEVLGRTGDGGMDGKGIARVHGLMSFHVVFQCKRYQGTVSAGEIRDFRGAMVGRSDKGLFITTGAFTRDAVREATRDGAPPIDLLDGDSLAEKLKELRLGIRVEMIENIGVEAEWFKSI